jgi:hypothetical protein
VTPSGQRNVGVRWGFGEPQYLESVPRTDGSTLPSRASSPGSTMSTPRCRPHPLYIRLRTPHASELHRQASCAGVANALLLSPREPTGDALRSRRVSKRRGRARHTELCAHPVRWDRWRNPLDLPRSAQCVAANRWAKLPAVRGQRLGAYGHELASESFEGIRLRVSLCSSLGTCICLR